MCLLGPALMCNEEHMLSTVRCTLHALHLQGTATIARRTVCTGNTACAKTKSASQPQLLLNTRHHQNIIINMTFGPISRWPRSQLGCGEGGGPSPQPSCKHKGCFTSTTSKSWAPCRALDPDHLGPEAWAPTRL